MLTRRNTTKSAKVRATKINKKKKRTTKKRKCKKKTKEIKKYAKESVSESNLENISPKPFTCEVCNKKFKFNAHYQKHKKIFPNKHKFYKCCSKVGVEDVHKCKKNLKISEIKANEISLETKNENCENDEDEADTDEDKPKKTVKRKLREKNTNEKNHCFKCEKCLETFRKQYHLTQHIKLVHKSQEKPKCRICEEEFSSNHDHKKHTALHGPEDKVMCKGCRRIFSSLKSYFAHAKQFPGPHCFLCKFCLRKFPTELTLELHVCICQNGKPLRCACGQEFTKYKDVIIHSKGTKPFYCCTCSHRSKSLTTYLRHIRKHSKQKPFQCSKCDMEFAVIDFLNIHYKKCHSDSINEQSKESSACQDYPCNVCERNFTSEEGFKKHRVDHELAQCPDCGKMLRMSRLENHRNTHKTSASLCPKCGKLFYTRFKLTQHMITIHSGDPIKCEVCSKLLKTKKILNEHMKTHLKSPLGDRIPQAICPLCGLGLAQKGSLARHILLTHERHKIVPRERIYFCQECSFAFPNIKKYYNHRRMHRAMVDRLPSNV